MRVDTQEPDQNPVEGVDASLAVTNAGLPKVVFSDLDVKQFTIRRHAAKKGVLPEDLQIQTGGLNPNFVVYVAYRSEKSVVQFPHHRVGDQHSRIGVRRSLELKLVQRLSS
jgi:hypothetical protein